MWALAKALTGDAQNIGLYASGGASLSARPGPAFVEATAFFLLDMPLMWHVEVILSCGMLC